MKQAYFIHDDDYREYNPDFVGIYTDSEVTEKVKASLGIIKDEDFSFLTEAESKEEAKEYYITMMSSSILQAEAEAIHP